MSRACGTCGNYGHAASSCALRGLQERKDPFGNRPRPKPQAISDPAQRDADEHTLFLNPQKEQD